MNSSNSGLEIDLLISEAIELIFSVDFLLFKDEENLVRLLKQAEAYGDMLALLILENRCSISMDMLSRKTDKTSLLSTVAGAFSIFRFAFYR
ncbi:hypothetical protein ABA45_02260 [Marinobacter psychrophilus]|uniref:Uncharacterized protein n=1 Tax=Marinobacter psychrophilus TaxID=330734 RepID=A0A0H4I0M5_9GAMM|nr:hypothetical protein ABA45_02260 [Marinobacter psychrophilus]